MQPPDRYDRLGIGYADARIADPFIFGQVLDALGDAENVVNVGAGTGNYEPTDRPVVAVEPNRVMRRQRTSSSPAIAAFAESLPFPDHAFDAALAMFTIHHWPDRDAGLRELGRVSRRQVALVYDGAKTAAFWLGDYFPALRPQPPYPHPSADWIGQHLPVEEVRPMLVPAGCTDGFAGCYWNRPARYLDPAVQAGMSVMARLPGDARVSGTEQLSAELESGQWDEKYGHLRQLEQYDMGYRLVVSRSV